MAPGLALVCAFGLAVVDDDVGSVGQVAFGRQTGGP
jgi:hypothetical protein